MKLKRLYVFVIFSLVFILAETTTEFYAVIKTVFYHRAEEARTTTNPSARVKGRPDISLFKMRCAVR